MDRLNSAMPWTFDNNFPTNTPIWILAEKDTCNPVCPPSIFRIMYDPSASPGRKTRLLDFDPDHEDEFLDPNGWEVLGWRPLTDHGGTWDKYYKDHGVTELSNWKVILVEPAEPLAGTFFEYRLGLANTVEMSIARELYDRICNVTEKSGHSCNFHIKEDATNPLCLILYNEDEETHFHFLSAYLLELGVLLKMSGVLMLTYAKLVDLEKSKDSDGGGCLFIDFDKKIARLTTTARIAHLYEKKKFFWWRRVFNTFKGYPHMFYES